MKNKLFCASLQFCGRKGSQIGENCSLGQNVNVYEGVELEDYVFSGPSMVFTNDLTPRSKYPKDRCEYKITAVKYGACIGANATVICGITNGRWAMIAAGSVVTKDVADYALMAGMPARQIGWVCECGRTLPEELVCKTCNRVYVLTNKELQEKLLISDKSSMC